MYNHNWITDVLKYARRIFGVFVRRIFWRTFRRIFGVLSGVVVWRAPAYFPAYFRRGGPSENVRVDPRRIFRRIFVWRIHRYV